EVITMTGLLSENIEPRLLFAKLDIGGTDSATASGGNSAHWVSMANHHRIVFLLFLGVPGESTVWNSGDDIATITVQQATDASGSDLKAVTDQTYTLTAGDLDVNGDTAMIEVTADQLDVDGGFDHVRIKVAATDNDGVDYVTAVAVGYEPR